MSKIEILRNEYLTILQAEYARAFTNPVFDEPEKYCVLLNLIKDAIEEEQKKLEWSPNA